MAVDPPDSSIFSERGYSAPLQASVLFLAILSAHVSANGAHEPVPPGDPSANRAHELAPTHDPSTPDTDRRSIVLVIDDLENSDLDERMIATVSAHLRAAKVEPVLVRAPGPFVPRDRPSFIDDTPERSSAVGVLWIDAHELPNVQVHAVARDGSPLASREMNVGDDAAGLEALANVAGSLSSLLIEHHVNSRKPTPATTPPVRSPPVILEHKTIRHEAPIERWPRLLWSVAYRGNTFARNVPWQHAVGLAVGWAPRPRTHVAVSYELVWPSRSDAPLVSFELRRHPIVLLGGYAFVIAPRWRLLVGVRFSVDPITRVSDPNDSLVPVNDRSVRVFVGVGPRVGTVVELTTRVHLFVDLGAEVLVTRAPYVAYVPERVVLVDPDPARFMIAIGLELGTVLR